MDYQEALFTLITTLLDWVSKNDDLTVKKDFEGLVNEIVSIFEQLDINNQKETINYVVDRVRGMIAFENVYSRTPTPLDIYIEFLRKKALKSLEKTPLKEPTEAIRVKSP